MSGYYQHELAAVDQPSSIGDGTKIWHFAHICAGSEIGKNCIFGQNTMVAPGVRIGDNVKVQNNVAIYTGTIIENDVFLGPSCVLTNVTNPRSQIVRRSLYEETRIRRGATVGANATIVCGISLGRYSFVAAGAVVAKDVPDYAFIVGVPGRLVGWMSRHGHRLHFHAPIKEEREELADVPGLSASSQLARCPESAFRYLLTDGVVSCIDLDEDASLPEHLAVGVRSYDDFKS